MTEEPVDHSGMRLGRKPSRPEDLARVPRVSAILGAAGSVLPELPAEIDHLSCKSRIDMLGNDVAGDCMYAALAHHIQSQTAQMGAERLFTTEEVLAMYSRDTGYNPDDPSTDNGASMFDALTAAVKHGFAGVELEGFALVDGTDFRKCHEGLLIGGGLLWGVDLPLIAKQQNRWRAEIGAGDDLVRPGGWGGHAVHQGYSIMGFDGLSTEKVTTWGAAKPVDQTFRDGGYIGEVYVAWIKGFAPKIADFDHARFLAGIREVRL